MSCFVDPSPTIQDADKEVEKKINFEMPIRLSKGRDTCPGSFEFSAKGKFSATVKFRVVAQIDLIEAKDQTEESLVSHHAQHIASFCPLRIFERAAIKVHPVVDRKVETFLFVRGNLSVTAEITRNVWPPFSLDLS